VSSAHRHRTPIPFLAVVAALAVLGGVAGLVALSLDGSEDPPPSSPAAGRTVVLPVSPEPEPESEPEPEPDLEGGITPDHKGTIVIQAAGDVNLDPTYVSGLARHGYRYAWSGLGGAFRDDDLSIVNLECAVSERGSPRPKEFVFRGDVDALPSMRNAGIEVANLGNNHSLDYGVEAMLDARRNLEGHRIAPVGAGRDARQANDFARFELRGWKVAVLGFGGVYSAVTDFATATRAGFANGDAIPSMTRAVRRADRWADLVVVMIHWGVELDTQPRPEDVRRAEAMVEAGADVIFGGHAHRLQPLERIDGAPVFYSLGNFVWPNSSIEGSTTGIARVVVRPSGRIRARLVPAFIEDSGHPVVR
jgi:poly-gamma-glutamate synthesis protein (capsule biosynthesis protein)